MDLPLVFVVDKKGLVNAQRTLHKGVGGSAGGIYGREYGVSMMVMTTTLKENRRAAVVEKKTFGKGIIQTRRQLSEDNCGVMITVTRYDIPNHNNIIKNGINVDVNVNCKDENVAVCIPASAFKTR